MMPSEKHAPREITLGSEAFKRAERRLEEWAAERARVTALLRVPVLSSMSVMVEYLRREEDPEQVVLASKPKKKNKKRQRESPAYRARACTNDRCRKIYAAANCPHCGQSRPELTAQGTASRSATADRPVGFSQSVAQIDGIIDRLRGDMKAAIFRGYMYRQPDRIAARELGMPRERFTWLREAAVIAVAQKLAERTGAAV